MCLWCSDLMEFSVKWSLIMTSDSSPKDQMLNLVSNKEKLFLILVKYFNTSTNVLETIHLLLVSGSELQSLFLTGPSGTGKTLMLAEALKIKLSRLKQKSRAVRVFVTTFAKRTKLLEKYREHYLVNLKDITFTDIQQLCKELNIQSRYFREPQIAMNSVVTSLSKKYSDSVVILLCDEVKNGMSADWSNMKTCHNVIWLLAVNPRSEINKKIKLKIVPPTTDQMLSQYMEIKYRNCIQIRYFSTNKLKLHWTNNMKYFYCF